MTNQKQPNPDNRKNNVERLHDMIENTKAKIQEAEASLEFVSPEEREAILEKNKNRERSIQAMDKEMKEEMMARKRGEI